MLDDVDEQETPVPVLSWFLHWKGATIPCATHQTYAKMTQGQTSSIERGWEWNAPLKEKATSCTLRKSWTFGPSTLHFWVSTYNIYNNTFANQLPYSGWTCKAAHLFQPGGLPKLLESTKAHSSADNFGKSARPQWSTAWPTPGHGAGSPWRRFQLGGSWRPQKKMTKVQQPVDLRLSLAVIPWKLGPTLNTQESAIPRATHEGPASVSSLGVARRPSGLTATGAFPGDSKPSRRWWKYSWDVHWWLGLACFPKMAKRRESSVLCPYSEIPWGHCVTAMCLKAWNMAVVRAWHLESGWYSKIFEPLGKSDGTQPDSRNPTRDQDYVPSLRSKYRLVSHRTRGEIKTIFIFIGQTTKRTVLTRVQPNLTTSLNLIAIVFFSQFGSLASAHFWAHCH